MRNAAAIKSQIKRLVRIFRRDDMRARLLKEFKDVIRPGNDSSAFSEQFKKMKQLWLNKLSTSLEDANRMQEQLLVSTKRVDELKQQKEKKQSDLDEFLSNSKDHKETRQKEIEDLKQTQQKHKQDRFQREEELNKKGEQQLKLLAERHQEKKQQLKA